ncbi:hypothetical protein DF118_26810, partial [Burkholderia stagnalis]
MQQHGYFMKPGCCREWDESDSAAADRSPDGIPPRISSWISPRRWGGGGGGGGGRRGGGRGGGAGGGGWAAAA